MADPLSITAGIAGLLSLGIHVTQTLVDFYAVYKTQDTNAAKITENIKGLQRTFRSLEVAVQEYRTVTIKQDLPLLQEIAGATQRSKVVIQELEMESKKLHKETKLSAPLKVRFESAGRRVAYPFRKSTIARIEEDIGEIREDLVFALNILQFKRHNRIEGEVADIKAVTERINTTQISVMIRTWLLVPDVSADQNAICAKAHPSTGLWFVNGPCFAIRLLERNSFLWLNGFAGCGKSVLCSIAIQHVFHETKQKSAVGLAFFYFSFNDAAKQDVHGMLRALLLQLSVQFEDGERELRQLYTLSRSGSPSVEALLQSLQTVLGRFKDSYIFLDALDESPKDGRREGVIQAIQKIREWDLPGLHLLVTSRNLYDIRESFNTSSQDELSMRNPGVDNDISDYIAHQLENDRKLQRWKTRHEDIQGKLVQGAQGVFRYVECQLNAIRRARNRNQLDECLRSLRRGLDGTYERMLCSIDEIYADDVRRILTVLCLAVRPLRVEELIHAHAIELGDHPHLDREGRSYNEEDLVDICLGLVEIAVAKGDNGESASIACIAHFSVQEYLQSERIRHQKAARFAVQSEAANAEMAQICLAYLLDSAVSTRLLDETSLSVFPLACFAATQWYHYYTGCREGRVKVETLIVWLFGDEANSFPTWIRLYDIDRPWDKKMDLYRQKDDMASPVYYASLLGLQGILTVILADATSTGKLCCVVNGTGGYYGTSLQAASVGGHEAIVRMLLDHGANIDAQGGWYGSALRSASWRGNSSTIQLLLDRGADINLTCGPHGTALQAASERGQEAIVELLLARGADANIPGGLYGSALQAASVRGHKGIIRMLLQNSANINFIGGPYGTALQAAADGGHLEIVLQLVRHGADIHAECGQYGTALQAARFRGHKSIISTLIDGGAEWTSASAPDMACEYVDHESTILRRKRFMYGVDISIDS